MTETAPHYVTIRPGGRSQMRVQLSQHPKPLTFRDRGVEMAEACRKALEALHGADMARRKWIPREPLALLGQLAQGADVGAQAYHDALTQAAGGQDVDYGKLPVEAWPELLAWSTRLQLPVRRLELTRAEARQLREEGFLVEGEYVPAKPKPSEQSAAEAPPAPAPPGFGPAEPPAELNPDTPNPEEA